MLTKLDDAILSAHQWGADRVACVCALSCYDLSRNAVDAYIACEIVLRAKWFMDDKTSVGITLNAVGLLLGLFIAIQFRREAMRLERAAEAGKPHRPRTQLASFTMRMCFVFFGLFDIPFFGVTDLAGAVINGRNLFILLACYWLWCVPRPPKRREAKLPSVFAKA